ncbi:hypothetical protein OPS25_15330 [Alteromonas ponticola]|uniref:Uncharacterized protein n=1 Tax=Alteromonas aquimaris TaxID=2998417 RepID=A0ABT3PAU4_9ALTE|nr:hypothetical protein [Alteromonas aquimaris]MCW8109878.1 hypothetical protein [Alteromonas aquimaris]
MKSVTTIILSLIILFGIEHFSGINVVHSLDELSRQNIIFDLVYYVGAYLLATLIVSVSVLVIDKIYAKKRCVNL